MQVQFETDDFGDEAASVLAAADGAAPEEEYHIWGRIVLDHPGQPTVKIFDDLTTLGYTLCVDACAALEREGRAELRLVGWPGDFTFVATGSAVRVTGSQGEDATFPRQELLAAIRACGQRLAAFMNELAVTSPQFGFSGQELGKHLANASE